MNAGSNNPYGGTAKVYCEPFVYTSMATSFGTGYHLVARGEKLSRYTGDVQDMVERMVILAQAANASSEIFANFSTRGSNPLVVMVKCTGNRDWQGRPGGFCSGLAFRREEMGAFRAGNMFSLEQPSLPFLTQGQVTEFLKETGSQAREAIFLKGLNLKETATYLRPGDLEFLIRNLHRLLSLARLIEAGESVQALYDDEAITSLRLVALLLSRSLREQLSVVFGSRRGLEHVGQIQLFRSNGDASASQKNPLLVDRTSLNRTSDSAFEAYLLRKISVEGYAEGRIMELLSSEDNVTSLDEYYGQVMSEERRQKDALRPTLSGISTNDVVASVVAVARRQSDPRVFFQERYEAWRAEPELLGYCLAQLQAAQKEVYATFVAAIRDTVSGDSSQQLRALIAQPKVLATAPLRAFWMEIWAAVPMPTPDEAMISRLSDLDTNSRRELLEIWVPQQTAAFVRSQRFLQSSKTMEDLSPAARRQMYNVCLGDGDPKLRAAIVQIPALYEFVEAKDLEMLDGNLLNIAADVFAQKYHRVRGLEATKALLIEAQNLGLQQNLGKHLACVLAEGLDEMSPSFRVEFIGLLKEKYETQILTPPLISKIESGLRKLKERDPEEFSIAWRLIQGPSKEAKPAERPPQAKDRPRKEDTEEAGRWLTKHRVMMGVIGLVTIIAVSASIAWHFHKDKKYLADDEEARYNERP